MDAILIIDSHFIFEQRLDPLKWDLPKYRVLEDQPSPAGPEG